MIKNSAAKILIRTAGMLAALCLCGCVKTQGFSYPDPRNPNRTLTVLLSYNLPSKDVFRLIIDGGLIFQKALDMKPQAATGWALATGWFEGEPVILSCSREYASVTVTWCDFSIGSGEHIKIKVY